ncbi:MAG: Trk system potassium transporter TrkA [Lachnospiraceae bacterium]|nr:Trk system potassium transporter TrkA [Lachnospiraceae bacterium]
MKIIIVGCGKVGRALIEQLVAEGHDITVIDNNAQKVQDYAEMYDVMGVVGNGASYSVQMEAGIKTTDLIIAVTDSDELNLLCCTIAKQVGECDAIARVRTPDYSEEVAYLREKLGLTMIINPDLESAKESARVLYMPTALEINSFAHGQVELIKFKIPEGNILDEITVESVGKEITNNLLICAVQREGNIFIPSGKFILKAGDVVSFVASRNEAKFFLKEIGFDTKQVKDTMIVGGGKAAYYLAKQLISMNISVKIIEQDPIRCEELSVLLPKAIIINGDGTNEELLKEEGIQFCESFVPLTGIDEQNILLSLHAKSVSKAKVITKINRNTFSGIISSMDLGSVMYPKYITSEAIIAYVRAKNNSTSSNIATLYHMFDSKAEAIEFTVDRESEVTGKPLMELSIKKDLLITFINRNGKIIIPSGQDTIEVGDSVMIFTTHTGFNSIKDILR